MKKSKVIALSSALIVGLLLAGCGAKEDVTLDPKHKELPEYVTNVKDEVKAAYVMAAEYPEALASVPCYCGCYEQDGHISNLDCFVDSMDSNNAVTEWDAMGVAWDICVVIAREATDMYKDGKELKEINKTILEKYKSYGTPTPTPVPK